MKTIIYFLLFSTILCFGQGPSQTENYVRTKIYRVPSNNTIPSPTINEVLQDITYLDGFGKPIQKIINQFSSTGKNIVISHEYDALGRKIKNYLPYSTQDVGLEFESNALIDVENYPSYQGQNPYHELLYEDSSLSRVLKQASSGSDWAMGSGHEMRFEYKNNISGEVKIFKARAEWNPTLELYDISLVENGDSYYDVNSLYKQIEKNENWSSGLANTTESFYNKEGQIILKRSYENVTAYDTYYVYDQFGNLTYVIPPKADNLINNEVLDGLCFQYVYDYKNRLVEKKLPGKNWEYIVYDKLDRVVMTGPVNPPFVNLTNNGWMIYKYDTFNRPILQGWMTSTTINRNTRKNQQLARDLITSNFSEIRLTANNVTPAGTGNSNNPAYSYSNVSLPTTNYYVLSINYYDDYNYIDAPAIPQLVEGQQVYYNNIVKPKGLLTGRWVKMIQNSTTASSRRELSYTLYDEKARPVRNFVRNHQLGGGGFTQLDLKFDFEGKVEHSVTVHKRIDSETPGVTVKNFYTYSNQGRLLTHAQQVNSNSIELIKENNYDELGKLISKKVGNTSTNPLQVVNYKYNIKGWLTAINNIDNLTQAGNPNDLFAFKINYNTVQNDLNAPVISKLYNGNISETYWKTASDNVLRKYAYKYDDLNRLQYAFYRLPGTNVPSIKSYDEGLDYDKNGNILILRRNGNAEGMIPPIVIDDLVYTYENDTNKLIKIEEEPPTATSGFIDGANNAIEYVYDNYGNMTKDDNKGITNILYNHLNLPVKITFGTTGTIEYIYNADGVKLEKKVTQGSVVTTTKYLQGFQYVNDVLQFFPHAEGYVAKQGSLYKYVFQYKDHLGNVRLSYTKNPTTGNTDVIEESHYYPFGLKHSGYNNYLLTSGNTEAQKYKYNGQEYQDELGLNVTAMDYRQYDNATGRFNTIDALSEIDPDKSPYAFARNSPVVLNDPTGFCPECEDYYEQQGYEPSGGEIFNSSGGAEYTFNEIAGQWDRTDLMYTLDEVVIKVSSKDDSISEIAEMALDLTPIGDLKDIYQGARDGNYLQLFSGIGFTIFNLATMGTGSLLTAGIKGGVKAVGRELLEEGAEELGKELLEEATEAGTKYLYHYTSKESAENILKTGLTVTEKRPFIYTTNVGNLSPLQAQIELALPVNRALPNTILQIDASGLNPSMIRRVQGNLSGLGAGGGTEFMFNQNIPANLIKVVR